MVAVAFPSQVCGLCGHSILCGVLLPWLRYQACSCQWSYQREREIKLSFKQSSRQWNGSSSSYQILFRNQAAALVSALWYMPRTAVLQGFSQLGLRSAWCQSEISFKSTLLITTLLKQGRKKEQKEKGINLPFFFFLKLSRGLPSLNSVTDDAWKKNPESLNL